MEDDILSYKYKVNAISIVGDAERISNEYFFVDGLTSLEDGMCTCRSVKQECKGKKHIFAVISESNNISKICDFFDDSISKPESDKYRIKIQYELKEMMEDIKATQGPGNDASDLSMIYIEGGNVYAAGFGYINIYRYNSEKRKAEKVVFPSATTLPDNIAINPGDSDKIDCREPARSKFVSSLKSGDRYLILSTELSDALGEQTILDSLMQPSLSVEELIDKTSSSSTSKNYSAISFTVKKTSYNPLIAVLALFLAMVIAVGWICFSHLSKDINQSENVEPYNQAKSEENEEKEEKTAMPDEPLSEVDEPILEKKEIINESDEKNLEPLKEELNQISSAVSGENSIVAYYVKNISANDVIQSNAYPMLSASLNNIYVMVAVYHQIEQGIIPVDDSIENDIASMIVYGDNNAANRLITLVGGGDMMSGFQNITNYAQSIGCQSTQHSVDLQSLSVDNVVAGNFTSVSDCGLILEKIYKGELVSEQYSSRMLDLLKQQQRKNKIPKYLPEGMVIANKTGDTDNIQNDVAIIYASECDYIVCIMINNYTNSMEDASEVVSLMSDAIYKYITK